MDSCSLLGLCVAFDLKCHLLQCYAGFSSFDSSEQYLDFIHFTLLISILITLKLDRYPNVIIQGIPRGPRLIIRLAEVGDEAAHILEVCELVISYRTQQLFTLFLPLRILHSREHCQILHLSEGILGSLRHAASSLILSKM